MNIYRHSNKLATFNAAINQIRKVSNKECFLSKLNNRYYLRQYPVLIVEPDGATYTIRYHEPRKIIKLPLDLSTLNEEEKIAALERRKPKKKVKIEEEDVIEFDSQSILDLMKKK